MRRRVGRCSGEEVVCRHATAGASAKGVRPKLDFDYIECTAHQIKIKVKFSSELRIARTRGGSPAHSLVMQAAGLVQRSRERPEMADFVEKVLAGGPSCDSLELWRQRDSGDDTIWLFREKLTKAGAILRLFERFDAMLREAATSPCRVRSWTRA
jgi:hypothetical protein